MHCIDTVQTLVQLVLLLRLRRLVVSLGSSAFRPLLSIHKVCHVEFRTPSDHERIERVTDRTRLGKPE
jgi:hypothetical protein